jgi:Uma2 family endonuclease
MNLNNQVESQNTLNMIALHFPQSIKFDDNQFFDFCQVNREIRLEKTAQGDCEIMAPTGWETGRINVILAAQLYIWAEQDGTGVVSDSSTGFILPNGAIRSPDVSWVKKSRLAHLTAEQKRRFLPLCPDFVIELKSPSDNLKTLQNKMQEYIENGASLGWLIDPVTKQVHVFQPNQLMFSLDDSTLLSADDLLKNFELNLQKIWDVGF